MCVRKTHTNTHSRKCTRTHARTRAHTHTHTIESCSPCVSAQSSTGWCVEAWPHFDSHFIVVFNTNAQKTHVLEPLPLTITQTNKQRVHTLTTTNTHTHTHMQKPLAIQSVSNNEMAPYFLFIFLGLAG